MNIKDIYEVEIINLDHQGRGIGKINNQIIFIPNSIPGDLVKIEITKIKKNFLEGSIINFIKKSEKRILPICKFANICGGCDLMNLNYDDQLIYKQKKVFDIIKKYSDLKNICVEKIIGCDKNLFYRNKITLQVKDKIGLYKKRSNNLVEIDKCYIVDEKINSYISVLKKIDLGGIDQIVIKTSKLDTMIIFNCNRKISPDLHLLDCNVIMNLNGHETILKGKNYIIGEIGDKKYKISPTSFFQVNPEQSLKLYNKIKDYLALTGDEKVLDLYCGTGTIGIYIADKAREVLGVEINPDAIDDANYNKKLNSIDNITFISGDSKTIINKLDYKADAIIVDPPRSGLDIKVINKIIEMKPKKLVYVSCDPLTLARDLKMLKDNFDVLHITPVDMFSHTYHVENVVQMIYNK